MSKDAAVSWVLLHGFMGSPASWDAVVESRFRLARLPAHTSIKPTFIRPTLLGHGAGAACHATSFDEEVDRIAHALTQSTHACFYLAGYSLGARLALGLLVRHPERFMGSVLIGVHPGLTTVQERHARVDVDKERALCLREAGLAHFVARWERLPLFQTQATLPTQLLDKQHSIRMSHRAEELAQSLEILGLGRMPSRHDALGRITQPTTLIAGAQDSKFCRIADAMNHKMPNASLLFAPDAGHNVLLEHPEFIAKAMMNMQCSGVA